MLTISKVVNKLKEKTIGLELAPFKANRTYFAGKVGLEIGGPSGIFGHQQILPVYDLAERVDGVNFSTQTVWENTIAEGKTYRYQPEKLGYQYILEASDLATIKDEQYDFLVASHSLEHCANTFRTIGEWLRVVKKGGAILIVVPDRRFTFDCNRPVTTLDHLLSDYEKGVGENDLTHLDEILELHDTGRDPGVQGPTHFRERSLKNYDNRCLHHHVFDFDLLKQLFDHEGIQTVFTAFYEPYHQIILGQK